MSQPSLMLPRILLSLFNLQTFDFYLLKYGATCQKSCTIRRQKNLNTFHKLVELPRELHRPFLKIIKKFSRFLLKLSVIIFCVFGCQLTEDFTIWNKSGDNNEAIPWGTCMMPTVKPATISPWRYSLNLYLKKIVYRESKHTQATIAK